MNSGGGDYKILHVQSEKSEAAEAISVAVYVALCVIVSAAGLKCTRVTAGQALFGHVKRMGNGQTNRRQNLVPVNLVNKKFALDQTAMQLNDVNPTSFGSKSYKL